VIVTEKGQSWCWQTVMRLDLGKAQGRTWYCRRRKLICTTTLIVASFHPRIRVWSASATLVFPELSASMPLSIAFVMKPTTMANTTRPNKTQNVSETSKTKCQSCARATASALMMYVVKSNSQRGAVNSVPGFGKRPTRTHPPQSHDLRGVGIRPARHHELRGEVNTVPHRRGPVHLKRRVRFLGEKVPPQPREYDDHTRVHH